MDDDDERDEIWILPKPWFPPLLSVAVSGGRGAVVQGGMPRAVVSLHVRPPVPRPPPPPPQPPGAAVDLGQAFDYNFDSVFVHRANKVTVA